MDEVNRSTSSYGNDTVFVTDALVKRNRDLFNNKNVAVIGSERPWIELILI